MFVIYYFLILNAKQSFPSILSSQFLLPYHYSFCLLFFSSDMDKQVFHGYQPVTVYQATVSNTSHPLFYHGWIRQSSRRRGSKKQVHNQKETLFLLLGVSKEDQVLQVSQVCRGQFLEGSLVVGSVSVHTCKLSLVDYMSSLVVPLTH